MYKVKIIPPAKLDISESAKWYNTKHKNLGKRFTQEVRNKVLLLRQNPFTFPKKYDNIHTAVLDIFPFMIHYTIDVNKTTIIILGVFHTGLSPEHWNKRKRYE